MAKVRVHNFAMSLDGFVAGPRQTLEAPLGEGGERLHPWVFETQWGRQMFGGEGGTTGIDNDFLAAGELNVGATIIGRNMFGPIRGPWVSEEWRGWWGPNPPYHHDVFVLTHHPRASLVMEGGTTFHFVADPIEDVLGRAMAAAAGQDVRIGGGAATVRQFLHAGLIDELHVALVPVLLGDGEPLFGGWPDLPRQYACVETVSSPAVTHLRLAKIS